MKKAKTAYLPLWIALYIVFCSIGGLAQDIEPRRWTPLPLDRSVLGVAYGRTSADLFVDPVLQVSDADVDVNTVALSYVKPVRLAGKLARFDAVGVWQNAQWQGRLSGVLTSTERAGLADPTVRLSVNLTGSPASKTKALRKYLSKRPVNTIAGAAIAVTVPLGEYFENRLLNLGQNRFTIRPQFGVVHSRGALSYELTGSVFLYTDNNDFFGGKKREQDPLFALQAHMIQRFRPGLWMSISAGYGRGGESTVDGVAQDDKRGDFLSGLSIGTRLTQRQSLKFAYIRGRTRKTVGADTDTALLAWSVLY